MTYFFSKENGESEYSRARVSCQFLFFFCLDDVYRSNIAILRPLSCPMHGHVIFQIIFENTEIFNIAWSHTQCPPQRLRPWPVKSGKNNNSGIMYWISSSIESKKNPARGEGVWQLSIGHVLTCSGAGPGFWLTKNKAFLLFLKNDKGWVSVKYCRSDETVPFV